jgi:uncharacterized protein
MSKQKKLTNILKGLGRVVVAYSGGLDSTCLLKAAVDALGRKNVLAVTARSETYPKAEYKEALAIARKIGARHITIHTKELGMPEFNANPVNRCYYCKRELFRKLDCIRSRYGMKYVLDGTNLDDLKDVRYGRKAAKECGVKSPLLQAGMTKSDIRRFSKALKLPTWNKPPFACLASRLPIGYNITTKDLGRIERAEGYLKGLGFRQVRLRCHGSIARLEVNGRDLAKALTFRKKIADRLKRLGFKYICLDIEGYRTGSMNT